MQNPAWWPGAIIYQIYPRSFYDSNGDGVGDLPGVAAKLDYVASLGVDAIWLSPFFLSPMRDFGYDVADHCAVDPVFGTLEDFDRLLGRAHALGLKVIVDLVCGHTSDQHPWFRDSRSDPRHARADWYVWADARPDGTPPNNWLSVFGGSAWSWEPRRRQYYLHHFLSSQPSLNLRHPPVTEALIEVARFWLERGVDGFRLDAIDFLLHDATLRDNPPRALAGGAMPAKPFALQHHLYDMMQGELPELLRRLRALADSRPGTLLLGEVSSQDGAYRRIERYTAGDGLHLAYTLRPLRAGDAGEALNAALGEIAAAGKGEGVCWAFSNHDVERAASRWGAGGKDGSPNAASVKLLMALLLSLKGALCVYQGEELGLGEATLAAEHLRDPFGIAYFPEFRGRDGSRTPMPWDHDAEHAGFTDGDPWLPVPATHRAAGVAAQEADPRSPLRAWRRLVAWRNAHPALSRGELTPLPLPAPLVGFTRATPEEQLLLVFNPGAHAVRFDLAPLPELTPLDGHGLAALVDGDQAVLPPYGALIAAVEPAAAAAAPKRAAG
ncbi:MAG TPA: alpha-glucosidase [Stellaceae bacterium]|nr:alpha-glucosidase [Stellaceae bacterium]